MRRRTTNEVNLLLCGQWNDVPVGKQPIEKVVDITGGLRSAHVEQKDAGVHLSTAMNARFNAARGTKRSVYF